MQNWEQRIDYLEESNDVLNMQNRVLATALKGLLRALPMEFSQEVIASIQAAFEDEMAQLSYENNYHADLFQDAVYDFFREKN
ncbi:MAG: hypothetical protein IKN18_04115 [Neisseriaceae bacterium]|nr:hypothetical protein [Neisseriaceae bacterium]